MISRVNEAAYVSHPFLPVKFGSFPGNAASSLALQRAGTYKSNFQTLATARLYGSCTNRLCYLQAEIKDQVVTRKRYFRACNG